MNDSLAERRMRVNRTATLALTTAWQTINFNGSSIYNVNTFGKDPVTGNNMVWYDNANQLFKFYDNYDRNYVITFYPVTTTPLITPRATIQVRLLILNGISPGVPLYVPYPEEGGYFDMAEATIINTAALHVPISLSVYINSVIRSNGFQIQVKLSNSLITLGTCTVNSIAVLITE